ncbi:tyrosine-type recombinase/integrase [Macrococcus equi]|uniref:tyrosine-type recombinase/integrase n=1 Tax=Macrococcus equi TaxID=3395462 RepID=UPI0039BE10DA
MVKRKISTRKVIRNKQSFDEVENIIIDIKKTSNLSEKTINSYQKAFISLNKYFKKIDPLKLTKLEAEKYIRYLLYDYQHYTDRKNNKGKKVGLAPSSVNTYLRLCKSIYNTLREYGFINHNPFAHIKTVKIQNKRVKTVDKDDINKLLNNLDKNYYTDFRTYVIILVLLDTMGRIGEVLDLTKDDIDLKNQMVYFSKTKTNNFRYVNFSIKTKRVLQEYIEITEEFNSEYLFLNSYGKKLSPDTFRKSLRDYSKKFGINKNFSCHSFRHTGATEFLSNGGSVRVLQKILGHSRITTTEIYTHVNEELIKKQHEKYNAINSLVENKKFISTMRRNKRKN